MRESVEKKVCKKIAKDTGMSYEETLGIIRTTTEYVKHVMENSGFETIMLPYFGKFAVKPYRLQMYNEGRIKKRTNEVIQSRKSSSNN